VRPSILYCFPFRDSPKALRSQRHILNSLTKLWNQFLKETLIFFTTPDGMMGRINVGNKLSCFLVMNKKRLKYKKNYMFVWRIWRFGGTYRLQLHGQSRPLLARWFLAEFISSTLKIEALCSSETSVDTQRTTRYYIPEDGTLYIFICFIWVSDLVLASWYSWSPSHIFTLSSPSSSYMALRPISGLGLLLWRSLILHLQTVGRTPWTSDQSVARPLLTQDNTNTE
jgi:hypothetical protein